MHKILIRIILMIILVNASCQSKSSDGDATLLLASIGAAGANNQPGCSFPFQGGDSSNCELDIKGEVSTFAGTGASGSIDGIGTNASFYLPRGLVSNGRYLFVADTYNHLIRKIDIGNAEVTTLAGSGTSGSSDGTGSGASFRYPFSLTATESYIFVADKNNHVIRRIRISTGEVTTFAGNGSAGSSDGIGTGASLSSPSNIATDGDYLYVTELGSHILRKINIETAEVQTLAGSGLSGFEDGTGPSATFNFPTGITTDGTYLYVCDTNNHSIRKIDKSTGTVTTIAGTGARGSDNGTGTSASFDGPTGIVTDGVFLYVSDTQNERIRRVSLSTMDVVTLAGSGSPGFTDGTGAAADFAFPRDIATDGKALFVADRDYSLIRKIQ